jgi:hypothetical protein
MSLARPSPANTDETSTRLRASRGSSPLFTDQHGFEIAQTVEHNARLQPTQQYRQSKYVLEHILRPSHLHSDGGAWI